MVATAMVVPMKRRENQMGMSNAQGRGLAAVDKRNLVDLERVEHELDADECQDNRKPLGKVNQALQQAADQKVQLAHDP